MKRPFLAALAASALSATALAQTVPSSIGSAVPSTGQVGASTLDTGSSALSPMGPNATDMDQPAGTSRSGAMTSSTGLDVGAAPSSISPGQLTPPSAAGLPELGMPPPSASDPSGVNSSLAPSSTQSVNR